MDSKRFIEAAQNAQTSIRLAELLHLAEDRICKLEAAIRDACSDLGCFGNFDECCVTSGEPRDAWCASCNLSTYVTAQLERTSEQK